eukprot:2882168-Rhodomonas_salina.1
MKLLAHFAQIVCISRQPRAQERAGAAGGRGQPGILRPNQGEIKIEEEAEDPSPKKRFHK